MRKPGLCALVVLTLLPGTLLAHAQGEDYVFFRFLESSIVGHFEIHFDDLRDKLGLQIDAGADASPTQVAAAARRVHEYVREHFRIAPAGGAAYTLEFGDTEIVDLPQGRFAQFHFEIDTGPLPDALEIRHSMFYEDDRLHRGLVLVEYNAKTDTTYPGEYTALVFSPTNRDQLLDLNDIPSIMSARDMVPQGVLHIWIGIDHILFLLALMLPTVLVRTEQGWRPVESFSRALWSLLKIVTVFTVAHSVTLVLAALDFIVVPSRLVESMIALSIILVAANNITGRVRSGSLLVVAALGLFHGLGFASVMGHLPFRMVDLLRVVVGFNIGVELGQVVIIAMLFPILFALRKNRIYEPMMLKGVSGVLILVASGWFVQRALGLG